MKRTVSNVHDLPPPPQGRTGWPWTEASPALPERRRDGSEWPRITIVTPSYNQAAYLEETIRSVQLQSYPNLEHIIIDGGSTDGSVEIIRRYAPFIDYWVSEKDGGQSQAINRGFARATGEIFGWLNSDDLFEPGALRDVAEGLSGTPAWLTAGSREINGEGALQRLWEPKLYASAGEWVEHFLDCTSCVVPQASTFWKRDGWIRAGPLREDSHYVFDHQFFLLLLHHFGAPVIVDRVLSVSRIHPACKSASSALNYIPDYLSTGLRHIALVPPGRRWRAYLLAERTRGRKGMFESIELAVEGRAIHSGLGMLKALLLWPPLLFDRMFLGFWRRWLLGSLAVGPRKGSIG